MQEKPRTFQTLDALRGVAALLVVLQHTDMVFLSRKPPHLWLGVDLFFVLSGFVLSYAYQDKLDRGLTTLRFMGARLVRLWPLYLLGLCLGAFATPPFLLLHAVRRKERAVAFLLGLFFLPARSSEPVPPLWPLDMPTWTLALELLMNAFHAIFLRKVKTRTLVLITACAGITLIVSFYRQGIVNGGWYDGSFFSLGAARLLFSYPLGMLLFRLWKRRFAHVTLPAAIPCLVLLLVLTLYLPSAWEGPFLLLAFTVFIPGVVLAGAYNEPGPLIARTFTALGAASYAIYILHFPLSRLFERLWPMLVHRPAFDCRPWSGLIFLGLLVVLCLWLDRVYDLPVRKRLRRWLNV